MSVLVCFSFTSCSDEPSAIGADLLNPDLINVEQVNSLTDSIPQVSSTIVSHIPLGSSQRLMVGRHANVEASFLIRFAFGFPDSVRQHLISNELVVNSAKIVLTKVYTFGSNDEPLEIEIEKITSSWTSGGFIIDSLPLLQRENILIDSLLITDSITTFKFDNAVALEWLKNAADPAEGMNWGLYIKPGPAANKVIGYQALTGLAENVPNIQLIVEKPGVYTDTLTFNPIADISVIDSIAPHPVGELMTIQSGLRIFSYLKFDINLLPQFAVINKAELILTADTTLNILSGDLNSRILGYIPRDTTMLDSTGSATVEFVQSGNLYTGNITSFVQDWLTSRNNRGLVLRTSNELNGLERFVLWSSNASPSMRPRLVITYTNKL